MFSTITYNKKVKVSPENNKIDKLYQNLINLYEDKIIENHYIIRIFDVEKINDGICDELTGCSFYDITFDAITFSPIVNETLDIYVNKKTDFGLVGTPVIIYENRKNKNIEIKCVVPKIYLNEYNDEKKITIKILEFTIEFSKISILGEKI